MADDLQTDAWPEDSRNGRGIGGWKGHCRGSEWVRLPVHAGPGWGDRWHSTRPWFSEPRARRSSRWRLGPY